MNPQKTIILASGNAGKIAEFSRLLSTIGFEVKPQNEFGVTEIPETGLTFVENAILKARNASKQTGLPALADDSGIEVDALLGAPGIYSARYAGEGCTDKDNNRKLLKELEGLKTEKRSARYQCLLVFVEHELDPTPIIAEGAWEGSIVEEPKGEEGFGYDPLFWVPSHNCTSAQLDKSIKSSISHRAIASKEFLRKITQKSL